MKREGEGTWKVMVREGEHLIKCVNNVAKQHNGLNTTSTVIVQTA